jgi:hypothetical protein
VTHFAEAYADQNERDYHALLDAVKAHKLTIAQAENETPRNEHALRRGVPRLTVPIAGSAFRRLGFPAVTCLSLR